MRKISFIVTLTLAALAVNASDTDAEPTRQFVRDFTCSSPENFNDNGYNVEVFLQGEVYEKSPHLELTWNGFFRLTSPDMMSVDGSKVAPWAFKANSEDRLLNHLNYKARKYVNHVRFPVDFRETAGTTQLIMPKEGLTRLESFESKPFQAYLIMNHIQDHFGTTVPLDCY
jgi:hypothetical protein